MDVPEQLEATGKPLKYCCAAKQYHINDVCISGGDTLKILPRVIIFRKCFKTRLCYESTINVLNNGLYKRLLDVTTDDNDTTVHINAKRFEKNFLLPQQSLQIDVHIEPKTKININRRRHVFITSHHPNITFSIPILILDKSDNESDISLPLSITFPATTPEQFSYYRLIVYNKSDRRLQFSVKCTFPHLMVQLKSSCIRRKEYADMLLKLYCSNLENVENQLTLKFNTGDKYDITFKHEPTECCLFADTLNINFECVRFKRRKTHELLICNDSNKDVVFNINFITQENDILAIEEQNSKSSETVDFKRQQNMNMVSFKHFAFEPKCGTIHVNSSYVVKISFCPIMQEDFLPKENQFSPFSIIAGVSISRKNQLKTSDTMNIFLRGEIIGPLIEISPNVLNVNDVYFGEQQLVEFTVQNKDDLCDAVVSLCELANLENVRIIATPKDGLFLKPNQRDVFRLQFYVTTIGSFLINLALKVKRGAKYSIILKGCSKPVRVKTYPDNINMGAISIAIPQKRVILLTNPLTIPITVQCHVCDDGSETPLVLNVDDTQKHLPVTVKDPSTYWQQPFEYHQEKRYQDFQQDGEIFQLIGDNDEDNDCVADLLSVHSRSGDNTSCSTEFAVSALEFIPDMSCQLISHLKSINILDQPEMEKKVIEEALNVLLETPYFRDMDKNKTYIQMDWNSLATDPQEIYCNTEIIYLKPKTGKAIVVVVVPNVVGYRVKHLQLRVCPLRQSTEIGEHQEPSNIDFNQIVKTEILSSKLRIEYNCSVPEIIWKNFVDMKDPVYAGEFYDFQMEFRNNSQFGGFFYYDVIPQSSLGSIRFANKTWKYFIESASKVNVPCQVQFTNLGLTHLYGSIKFVGVRASHPFHIQAEVLPPAINISPHSITKTLSVFETSTFYIFIENATPTSTWFNVKLKESTMSFEPSGGQLAPNGQATYVSVTARFQDPGIYKNILYLILKFDIVEKIPITINVRGMPLFFEPEIRGKDLNFGHLLCDSEETNCDAGQLFTKIIKVINKGLRSYRLSITRTKNSAKGNCARNASQVKTTIKPNNLVITALSEVTFNIILNSMEVTSFYSEFRLQLTEENSIKHKESHRFTLSAEFIIPELSWNRREITMKYQRSNNNEHSEIVKLKNNIENCVENVKLKISGPFKMKEFVEHEYEKELNFSMKGFETKEIFIGLNKETIDNSSKEIYEGSILCSANFRAQKPMQLKVFVYIPKITLKEDHILLFAGKDEGATYVELSNTGRIPATYKWKKLKEEWRYISQEDDVWQVASMILSDLLDIVEQKLIDADVDSQKNLPHGYQTYKCTMEELKSDAINVKEIVYEIIQNLDLNGRRYEISYKAAASALPQLPDYLHNETKSNEDQKPNRIHKIFPVITEQEILCEIKATGKEICEKSETLFANLNLQTNCSHTTVAATQPSNTKTCVHYCLNDILDHLKLDNSCGICSIPSTETGEVNKETVYFLENCGQLPAGQKGMCALHIPSIRKGYEVRTEFQLEVVGGKTHQLQIVFVNFNEPVTVSKQNIYLGLKPWYERYRATSCIQNRTNYQLILKLDTSASSLRPKMTKIANGFCNIVSHKTLQLSPFGNTILKLEGIIGFTEDFKSTIKIMVNDSKESVLEIYGHGGMPMLALATPFLPLLDQQEDEIHEEYCILQKIYYFEIFKSFTEPEEDSVCAAPEEENDLHEFQSCWSSNISDYNSKTPRSCSQTKQNFLKLMQAYVFVSQNGDLPNHRDLKQLLQTEKFLNRLRLSPETSALLTALYHNYLLHCKNYDEQLLLNLKHFSVQSLPFNLNAHILEMGKVYLNQFSKITLTLDFYGPGKLIAGATTAVKIPGLMIDFQVFENCGNKHFIYYSADDVSNSCAKTYRNIYERVLDKEMNPKVRHAHSYDFDAQQQHRRIINPGDNKCLRQDYHSLNKSIYLERKHHFTYCKIAGKNKYFNATSINVTLLFRPQKTHFQHNQYLEDYLFIDLHMGTTLPILMRALIIDPKRMNKS